MTNDGTRKFTKGTELGRLNAVLYIINKVRGKVESVGNRTSDLAAQYFSIVFQPVSTKYGVELSANIVNEGVNSNMAGLWYLRNIDVGRIFDGKTGIGYMAQTTDVTLGGFNVHTHPLEDNGRGWNSPFSTGDILYFRTQKSTGYVSVPSMKVYKTDSGGPIQEIK